MDVNPLFLYANKGQLSDEALKKIGSDYSNLPCGQSLFIRMAVILRDFFESMQCCNGISTSLNNYFINRGVTVVKDQNCQLVKESFNINSDFHGWCIIEQILGLEKNSLIKTGDTFAMIKGIYDDFQSGDKPNFKFEFSSADHIQQNEFILKYRPEYPVEKSAGDLSDLVGSHSEHEVIDGDQYGSDDESELTDYESGNDENEEKIVINQQIEPNTIVDVINQLEQPKVQGSEQKEKDETVINENIESKLNVDDNASEKKASGEEEKRHRRQ